MALPGNIASTGEDERPASLGKTYTDILWDSADSDFYKVTLNAGGSYTFHLTGSTSAGGEFGPLADTQLTVYDANGLEVVSNDDYGGSSYSSIVGFAPTTSGTYYLGVAAFQNSYAGGYQLILEGSNNLAPVPPSVLTSLPGGTVNNSIMVKKTDLLKNWTDPDGDTLSISETPLFLSGNNTLAVKTTSDGWAITPTDSGTVTVNYTVTDGKNSIGASSFLTVQAPSEPNFISMTRIGDGHTIENGGEVRYTLAVNNALTAGSFTVVLNTSDPSEGVFVTGEDQTATTQTLTFDANHKSFVVTVAGVQDFLNDDKVPYQITAHATDGIITPASSKTGSWTSAIREFHGGSVGASAFHIETLYNDGDTVFDVATQQIRDRDVPVYVVGDHDRPTEDVLAGYDGEDRLYSGYMIDVLRGGIGNDRLYGGYEDDQLYGEEGSDMLYGEQDDDYLNGGSGNDRLDGGIGYDTMVGGAGSDTYYLTLNDDGGIEDTVAEVVEGVDPGLNDRDTVYIPFQVDSYVAPAGIEIVRMNAGFGNTQLTGNTSNNGLYGNAGDNVIDGAAGNDVVDGGPGNDELTGGKGNDTFVLNGMGERNADDVDDFSPSAPSNNDQIALSGTIYTALNDDNGITAPEFVANSSGQATAATQNLIYETDTGDLWYDANGNAAGGVYLIAQLDINLSITYRDFVLQI